MPKMKLQASPEKIGSSVITSQRNIPRPRSGMEILGFRIAVGSRKPPAVPEKGKTFQRPG